ncbi:unnamed protein product [Dimorphilus gyrociliatus]|uniref:Uncharacterized protein n=1 Tax=Dimorphilus gyrociliatus TaxID=2664684 RepID=A0A7I8W2S2_9ANNE|nr:unnamed protein product [Dimorphilus gyrociliatus]
MQRTLSITQLFLLNSVVCGLEFCASAAFTYIPPLLLKSGLEERQMSIVLGIGPLMGLFLVPVIGKSSDACHSRYGRRRPFILGLGFLLIFSLFFIAFTDNILNLFVVSDETGERLGIALLIIGAVLLDFTSQVCLTPCEALLSDALSQTGTSQERGFMIYSIMISVGGCVGYLVAAVNWTDSIWSTILGKQETAVFSLLIFLFSICLCCTLMTVQEVPDETNRVESFNNREYPKILNISIRSILKLFSEPIRAVIGLWKSVLPSSIVLRRLSLAHFFSWSALMAFNLFYTDFMGQAVYGGNPNAPEDSNERALYDEGIRMGSWGLLLHCITSAVYASFIEKITTKAGNKKTYLAGILSFIICMLVMLLFRNIVIVLLSAAFTGFAYATLTTVPYTLVNTYHSSKQIFFADVGGSTPRGIGADLATLDSAYFLSQVMLSLLMGNIVYMTGTVFAYLLCAVFLAILSGIFVMRLITIKGEMQNITHLIHSNEII